MKTVFRLSNSSITLVAMKEKRVDVYLASASFFQLIFLGFGGTFAAELIKNQPSDSILLMSSLFAFILTFIIAYIYTQVFYLTKS